jgi:hypothetical protein
MPFACGLDGNTGDPEPGDRAFEPAMALDIVADPEMLSGGQHMNIEPVFADIDADVGLVACLRFGSFLTLHTGRPPYHLLRASAEERVGQAFCGAQHQDAGRPHPSALESVATGPSTPSIMQQIRR